MIRRPPRSTLFPYTTLFRSLPRLRREIAPMLDSAVPVIGDLPREEQHRLGPGDSDPLAVAGGIVHARRAEFLDLRHRLSSRRAIIRRVSIVATVTSRSEERRV